MKRAAAESTGDEGLTGINLSRVEKEELEVFKRQEFCIKRMGQ